jgi:peptidoglycan/LPS O-acetylase OafA/YrhL
MPKRGSLLTLTERGFYLQHKTSKRLIHLEAARGIAALIVIFHHFTVAFVPWLRAPFYKGGLQFTPFFDLINGAAAVQFFFLLSGFVLTQQIYKHPSPTNLIRSVLKRFPRLLVPASVTILAGLVILLYVPHYYEQVAPISGSEWLSTFGNAKSPANFVPSLASAIRQIFLVFLLPDNFYYNPNLWTMFNEFYGSLLVFALAGIAMISRRVIAFHAAALVGALVFHHDFVPFVLGSGLAYTSPTIRMSPRLLVVLSVVAIVSFSIDRWSAEVVGSCSTMLILLGTPKLASTLSGRTGSLLGQFSFPIYLVHTLVILSSGSLAFQYLGVSGALLITLGSTFIFSLPLIALESAWLPRLNAVMKALIPPPILKSQNQEQGAKADVAS